MKTILTTGGAGFIGSHFVRYILESHAEHRVVNLDKLTYAGNLANLKDVEKDSRYEFMQGDIGNAELVNYLMQRVDMVVNFALKGILEQEECRAR